MDEKLVFLALGMCAGRLTDFSQWRTITVNINRFPVWGLVRAFVPADAGRCGEKGWIT